MIDVVDVYVRVGVLFFSQWLLIFFSFNSHNLQLVNVLINFYGWLVENLRQNQLFYGDFLAPDVLPTTTTSTRIVAFIWCIDCLGNSTIHSLTQRRYITAICKVFESKHVIGDDDAWRNGKSNKSCMCVCVSVEMFAL